MHTESVIQHFPFARSARSAHWPSDIPQSHRRGWKKSLKAFSATWRIPPGTGFDQLRVELRNRHLILMVRLGVVQIWHGNKGCIVSPGQAVAISAREVFIRVHDCPIGDAIVDLHLLHRIPSRKNMSSDFADLLARVGPEPRGIFPYPRGVPGILHYGVESSSALLNHLIEAGFESTMKFMASAGAGMTSVRYGPVPDKRDAIT